MKPFRVIIAGSRTVERYDLIVAAMNACPFTDKITEVVSGCAAGADLYGEQWAKKHMKPIVRFPADWRRHGKAAGPRRNTAMAHYADALIAVWDGASRGTENMIDTAYYRGLYVFVYNYGEKTTRYMWRYANEDRVSF